MRQTCDIEETFRDCLVQYVDGASEVQLVDPLPKLLTFVSVFLRALQARGDGQRRVLCGRSHLEAHRVHRLVSANALRGAHGRPRELASEVNSVPPASGTRSHPSLLPRAPSEAAHAPPEAAPESPRPSLAAQSSRSFLGLRRSSAPRRGAPDACSAHDVRASTDRRFRCASTRRVPSTDGTTSIRPTRSRMWVEIRRRCRCHHPRCRCLYPGAAVQMPPPVQVPRRCRCRRRPSSTTRGRRSVARRPTSGSSPRERQPASEPKAFRSVASSYNSTVMIGTTRSPRGVRSIRSWTPTWLRKSSIVADHRVAVGIFFVRAREWRTGRRHRRRRSSTGTRRCRRRPPPRCGSSTP